MSDHPNLPLQLYCKQLTALFQQSIYHRNPAGWLYKNDARSPLFMAESLTRILVATTGDKRAEKAGRLFKKLEDLLGAIDDYDHLAKYFATCKTIKKKGNKLFYQEAR